MRAGTDRYVDDTGGSNSGSCTSSASPYATIYYAINQSSDSDTIHIADGTYNEYLTVNKHLTFSGASRNGTIITGSGSSVVDNVVDINSGKTVSMHDLTIQNGYALYGGGINNSGTLYLQRVLIKGNKASEHGGGIYNSGTLDIQQTTISGNDTVKWGGGIYSSGALTMHDVWVTGNAASGLFDPKGYGGGIFMDSTASMVLTNVTISGNSATVLAGGIFCGNSGGNQLTNVTISGNTANQTVGGLNTVSPANTLLVNSTIANNSALLEGNVTDVFNSGTLQIKNTIVVNNTAKNCYNLTPSGIWTSLGNNLDSGTSCKFTQSGDLQNAVPLLGALADNGGYTQTHALAQTSPAVDVGTNSGCPSTDQRGVARPKDGDGDGTATCDIGAYEYEIPLTTAKFRSTADNDGWVLEKSETSETGGSKDATATTLRVGDDAKDRQYRTILDFNTASLPDNAVITSAVLKIKMHSVSGTDPFSTHGKLLVDMRKGYFGSAKALQTADFEASASINKVKYIANNPVNNWYKATLPSTAYSYIHLKNVTQIRLRFQKGDNDDNAADYMNFYSGNASGESSRPLLIVKYYVP